MRSDCLPVDYENREDGGGGGVVVLFLISNHMTCQLICTVHAFDINTQGTSFCTFFLERLRFSLLLYLAVHSFKMKRFMTTQNLSTLRWYS